MVGTGVVCLDWARQGRRMGGEGTHRGFTPEQEEWIAKARRWWISQGECSVESRIVRLGVLLESVDAVQRWRAERAELALRRVRADLEEA